MTRWTPTFTIVLASLVTGTGCASFDARAWPATGSSGASAVASVRSTPTGESTTDAAPAVREDDLPAAPGLADYLRVAALRNPGLAAAFERWKAALERVPQVQALPDPKFTYRYYISEVETRVGAQRQAFGLAQTFPWFGKLPLRGSAAAEQARAAHQEYEQAKLALFQRVKDAYYEYAYLARHIEIVRQNVALVKHLEEVARTRYRASAAGHPDVIRAQVELGKLDERLRSVKDLRQPIVARLNATLNRAPDAELPWPAKTEDVGETASDAQWLAWLAESSPQIRALDAMIAKRKHEIELARKDYYPDVTVGMDWINTADRTGASPSDDGKDAVIGMVSLNLPIWRDKLDAGVREAKRRHSAAARAQTQKLNELNATLKLALYRYRDADRKIRLYRDTLVPKATESLKATEVAFRAGKAGFLDLIDSQRVLLEFLLVRERALADKAQRLAEIESLVGRSAGDTIPAETNPADPRPTPVKKTTP